MNPVWKRFGSAAAGLAFVALTGCSATRTSNVVVVPGKLIPRGSQVYILKVADGQERREGPAAGSGFAVATGLRDALFAQGFPPLLSDTSDLEAGLADAATLHYDYLLRAVITEWEDNATAISTRPDRAALSVEVYDVSRRELIATSRHEVSSGHGDYKSRTPDRFVPELADFCLGSLFGWTPTIQTKH